jgi:hypothetical protein
MIVTLVGLHDIYTPCLQHVGILHAPTPPDGVWMRPNRMLLATKEGASIKAVCM